MAKGGARARSGPAPDPNALRRDRDAGEWTVLPSGGRLGDAPGWPLSEPSVLVDGEPVVLEEVRERELAVWAVEWTRPQAVMWERNGQEFEVALYVRSLVAAERVDATAASRTLVKQLQEALGLSLPGLARNKWRIEDAAPAAVAQGRRVAGRSARERFGVVQGGRAD